jgi:hypothetical protein
MSIPSRVSKGKTLRVLGIGAGVLLGIGVAFGLWSSYRFQQWVEIDSRNLEPFPHILVADGVAAAGLSDPLDPILIEKTTRDRLVVEFTRSDYRRGLLGNEAWVKTHLVTRKPGDDTNTIQIKLLHRLEKKNGEWRMTVEELALP